MKPLSDILLQRLGQRARRGERLRDRLAKTLPDHLADALVFARFEANTLFLTVNSAGAATRLRFCQRDMLAACKPDMQPTAIKFKVSPRTDSTASPRQARDKGAHVPKISEESAEHINSVAKGMECDALRAALERLSSRRGRP